jgi:hypothetical protein
MHRAANPLYRLVVWAASIGNTFAASSSTRHVVMVFDERVELPGLAALEAEFVGTLTSNSPDRIETYRESMDLSGSVPTHTDRY